MAPPIVHPVKVSITAEYLLGPGALRPKQANLGFRVWGLGLRVSGLGFKIQGLGLRVQGLGFRAYFFEHSIFCF